MESHFHFHFPGNPPENPTQDGLVLQQILSGVKALLANQKHEMDEIDILTKDVTDQTTVINSANTLLAGLAAQLKAAGTDPVKLAALQTAIEANTASLSAAVAANTPAAPAA